MNYRLQEWVDLVQMRLDGYRLLWRVVQCLSWQLVACFRTDPRVFSLVPFSLKVLVFYDRATY